MVPPALLSSTADKLAIMRGGRGRPPAGGGGGDTPGVGDRRLADQSNVWYEIISIMVYVETDGTDLCSKHSPESRDLLSS